MVKIFALDLVPCASNANIVSCKWVYTLKYNLVGITVHQKALLVSRGSTQAYDIEYKETFSLAV